MDTRSQNEIQALMSVPNSGATDLLTALQNAVQAFNTIATDHTKASFFSGSVVVVNSLSTTATQVLSAASSRTTILFHNPSDSNSALVAPSFDINGASITLTYTSSTRGGGYLVLPQSYLQFSGNCQTPWTAVSSGGTNNPLTISVG